MNTTLSHPRCECCEQRPVMGVVALVDGMALLCGTCLDDAQALGLIAAPTDAGPVTAPAQPGRMED